MDLENQGCNAAAWIVETSAAEILEAMAAAYIVETMAA
jgi:hypothetical protein